MQHHDQDFRLYFDIIKSVHQDDGRVYVSGIATDESEDFSNEIVAAALNPRSIDYLNKFGKFNYDHRSDVIGDITAARFITPKEAKERYGAVIKGTGIEVEGWVQPLDADPANLDLRNIHRLVKGKSKLGFSLHSTGVRGKIEMKDGTEKKIAIPTFIPQIAIVPQPMNTNTACIVKSLSDLISGQYKDDLPEAGDGENEVIPTFIFPSVKIDKSLMTTGAIAQAGTTGGDSLKESDTGSIGRERTTKKRICCGRELASYAKFCPSCGERYRTMGEQTRLIKSAMLQALDRIAG